MPKSDKPEIELTLDSSRMREKTMFIANKVKQKISQMKENNPIGTIATNVSTKHNSIRDRNNSSSFSTNPLQTMKSFREEKVKKLEEYQSVNYFSK